MYKTNGPHYVIENYVSLFTTPIVERKGETFKPVKLREQRYHLRKKKHDKRPTFC